MKLPPLTLHKLSASIPWHSKPHSYLHIDSESSCCSHELTNRIYWKQLQSLNNSVKTPKSRTLKSKPGVTDPQGQPREPQLGWEGLQRRARSASKRPTAASPNARFQFGSGAAGRRFLLFIFWLGSSENPVQELCLSDCSTPFEEQQGFIAIKLSTAIECLDDLYPENLGKPQR